MSPGGTGPTTLAQLGEFALIAEIVRDLPEADDVLVGPGDDGAVLAVGGSVVVSTDVLVEGVHFRRDWSGPGDIGRKAVAVNVADIEAMGARPQGVVVGFSAPGETEVRWTLDLAAGLRAECATAGVSLLGGDTTRGQRGHPLRDRARAPSTAATPSAATARVPATCWPSPDGSAGRPPACWC